MFYKIIIIFLLFIQNYLFIVPLGELKLNYLKKMYIVIMHTIKISILLLFEDCDSWKYSEIFNALEITNEQFEKHINSLLECELLLLDCK